MAPTLKETVAHLRSLAGRADRRLRFQAMRVARVNVLDGYTEEAPSPQAALDIFRGEYVSAMPPDRPDLRAGDVRLFDDGRIRWLAERFDVADREVLELGPLEAGHSSMLQGLGARRVTAIESNSRAYLKSLVVKEVLGLDRVDLRYGNFVAYLRERPRRFDLCVASGVLYHVRNPVELLAMIASATDHVFLWTHYYDEAAVARSAAVRARFTDVETVTHDGRSYPVHHYDYGVTALGSPTFCGGNAEFSRWMERDDILDCLRHHGLTEIEVGFDHADHQNGPSFAVFATRVTPKC